MLYKREILDAVIQCVDEYAITLITGARQVGKTTLVSYFEKEKGFTYLSFDDTDLLAEAKSDPKRFIDSHRPPLILDEVQRVPEIFLEIEAVVNRVKRIEGSQAANGMYILTGSQKFNLMKEVSESMSGRVGIVDMPPLSQREIRGWDGKEFTIDNEGLLDAAEERELGDEALYESIVRGFYPARWEITGKPIKNYYANYVKTYVERDVSELIHLRDRQKFENLLRILASLTGEEYVPDNIAKTLGVDKNTVSAWVSIAVTGDIVRLLQPYYEDSINKRIVKRNKLFFNDTGLACYLLGIDSPASLKRSTFKGRMVETYIHNEIYKSYLNRGIEPKMFFYRDNNQNEIDLILVSDGKLDFIECKAGKKFGGDAIKGFRQLANTKYEINGQCVLCTTEDPYRIASGVFAFPIRCL